MLSSVFLWIHSISHCTRRYWFFLTAKCTGHICFFFSNSSTLSTVLFIALIFSPVEPPKNNNAKNYMPLCTFLGRCFFHVLTYKCLCLCCGNLFVCPTSLHLGSASLLCPVLMWVWHIIHQRAGRGACFSHLHLEHAESDTHFIVSCAPATLWPASQWIFL